MKMKKLLSACVALVMILGCYPVFPVQGTTDGCDALESVQYWGTEEQWEQIYIDECNDSLLDATLYIVESAVTDGAGNKFTSLTEAIEAVESGTVLTLQKDIAVDVAVNKDVVVNLNGFDITGAISVKQGCTLTVKDTQTDDCTVEDGIGYGKLTEVSGTVVAAEGYLQIAEADGISFHKVDLHLTSVTLRPEAVGMYYNGEFFGDEVVAANVESFGIALRLNTVPDAAYMRTSSAYSWYKEFAAGTEGNAASGALLKNIMVKGKATSDNAKRAQSKVYGSPYILTKDGRYLFGDSANYSLYSMVRQADAQWSKLSQTQKNAVKKLYNRFESVIGTWYLPNINDTDIDIPI